MASDGADTRLSRRLADGCSGGPAAFSVSSGVLRRCGGSFRRCSGLQACRTPPMAGLVLAVGGKWPSCRPPSATPKPDGAGLHASAYSRCGPTARADPPLCACLAWFDTRGGIRRRRVGPGDVMQASRAVRTKRLRLPPSPRTLAGIRLRVLLPAWRERNELRTELLAGIARCRPQTARCPVSPRPSCRACRYGWLDSIRECCARQQ